jgi:pumilio family protein 6
MKGHLCKLAVHAVGARVVELFFSTIPAKQTHALRQEFYGPHFSLFADATLIQTKTPTLQSNIDLHPDKKEAACDFVLNNLVQKGLDKGLYGFAYFQQLLSEYLAVVGHNKDLIANLVDNSLHLLSTRAGTQIVSYCVAYGTAKDRKRILKALKGYTRSSLLHRDAYLAILQVVLVTDDTVSVHKSLLAELLTVDPEKPSPDHALLQIAVHDQASKLLLLLVSGTEEVRNKFLDPLELAVLQTNPMIMDGGVEVPTSKKNHDTRRKELLQYMIRPLEQLCLQHTNQLTRSLAGSRVVQQVYKTVKSEEMRAQLVQLCVAGVEEGETSLLEDPVGHYLIKHLVSEDDTFAQALTESLDLSNLTSSRAAFVVTALCKTAQRGAVTKKVNKSKLQATMKSIKKKDEKATTAGFEALLKALNEKK